LYLKAFYKLNVAVQLPPYRGIQKMIPASGVGIQPNYQSGGKARRISDL
jgi:hypothetical protein